MAVSNQKFYKSHRYISCCWFMFSMLCVVAPGWAAEMPTGGTVTYGNSNIIPVDLNHLLIEQKSNKTIIDWNTFSINKNGWVEFQQPNSNAAALNRVTGNFTSFIL